jgi:hypothetical protein
MSTSSSSTAGRRSNNTRRRNTTRNTTATQRSARGKAAAKTRNQRAAQANAGTAAEQAAKAGTFQVQELALQAQRPALVYAGAVLTAAENVADTARKYRNRTDAQREVNRLQKQVTTDLKKFERRGERAKKRVEREVKKTRTELSDWLGEQSSGRPDWRGSNRLGILSLQETANSELKRRRSSMNLTKNLKLRKYRFRNWNMVRY